MSTASAFFTRIQWTVTAAERLLRLQRGPRWTVVLGRRHDSSPWVSLLLSFPTSKNAQISVSSTTECLWKETTCAKCAVYKGRCVRAKEPTNCWKFVKAYNFDNKGAGEVRYLWRFDNNRLLLTSFDNNLLLFQDSLRTLTRYLPVREDYCDFHAKKELLTLSHLLWEQN